MKTMSETECFRVIGKFVGGDDEEEKKFFLLIDPSSSIEDVEKRIAQVIPNLPSKLKDNINLYIDDVYLPKYESAQIIKKKDVLTIRDKMPIARKRKRRSEEVEKNEDVAVENDDVQIDVFEPAELPKRKRKRKRKKNVSLESEETLDNSKLNGAHSNGELASLFNLQHRKVFRKSLISNGVDEVKQEIDVDEIKPSKHVRFSEEVEEEQTPTNNSNVNGNSYIKNIEIENCSVITDNKYENDSIILFQIMKLDESYCPIISDFILAKIISVDDNEGSLSVKVLEGAEQLEVPQGKFFMEDENAEEGEEDKIIKYCDIKYSYLVPSDLVQFNHL